jgi:hypothetical protein
MRNTSAVLLAILVGAMAAHAETHISGDIHAMNIEEAGNPYIVDQDIVVPAGKKSVIKEGCVFLFKNYTGLKVEGQLSVEGTPAKPVVLTSVNDNDHNPQSEQLPNSFDWNGVLVAREATGASFQHFQLKYSVYGIKAQNTSIQIADGLFSQNGQFHFTINDKIQYVQDNVPYTYNASATAAAGSARVEQGKAAKQKAEETPSKTHGGKNGKPALRWTCFGVGVAGVAVGTTFVVLYGKEKTRMAEIDKNPGSYTHDEWTNTRSRWQTDAALTTVGFVLGGLGLVGFGLTFVF